MALPRRCSVCCKIGVVLLISLLVKPSAAFKPLDIPWGVLLDEKAFASAGAQEALKRGLSEVGLITISGIPGYDSLQPTIVSNAHECAKVSKVAMTEHFSDLTTHTSMVINGQPQEIYHGDGEVVPEACIEFQKSSAAFRKIIDKVSLEFVRRVSEAFKFDQPLPLDQSISYGSLSQVVQSGTQLEHYHSYNLPAAHSRSSDSKTEKEAFDFHTDQGLFLAFSPAMMVLRTVSPLTGETPGIFWIKMEDGSEVQVIFEQNSLAFMVGDGVNHFINPRLNHQPKSSLRLRATPHALDMPILADEAYRVNYARIFLPPLDADVSHDTEPTLQPTCRSPNQSPILHKHSYPALFHLCELATSSCEKENHLSCWRDCMQDHGHLTATKPSMVDYIWPIRQAFTLLLIRFLLLSR